ncbi:MAG: histidinol-phosphate transaminase [Robiginitomaculum sp.]|nr:histidinol-phosphate transaminase [Robiginitomaculum sp.]
MMSKLIKVIAREEIAKLNPYAARGAALENVLQLDANESPWSAPGSQVLLNRYPAQQPEALVSRMAALYGVSSDKILLCRGADEGIDLLLRATCGAGKDAVIITPPTFGFYAVAAKIQGANIINVPLGKEFELPVNAIIDAAKSNPVKLIFLCSPNNPTGSVIQREEILKIAAACPRQLIIVDEAYVEFAYKPSLSADISATENLVILRTLSKAYSLAAARLGTVLANAPIIELLRKVLPPYPLATPVIDEVKRALSSVNMAIFAERIARLKSERERVFAALVRSEFIEQIWPSEANFLLVKLRHDTDINRRLQQCSIQLRDFSNLDAGMVRISVGSQEQNNVLLAAFAVAPEAIDSVRSAVISRQTKETQISVMVDLEEVEPVQIDTGIGFFDHMLEQIARHGGFSLVLNAKGDLHIDDHHTVEDCAIVLGQALFEALGDRAGIGRYGFTLPMDEAQARVAIDLSGRAAFRFTAEIPEAGVSEFSSQMVSHFFETLSQQLKAAIHIEAEGKNTHHIIEAIFKGFGRALRPALNRQGRVIPSSKGSL